ncbi:MAG: IS1 family transposase [Bergeyella sp.]
MEVKIYLCSTCVGTSAEFIKYGKTACGKQRYQCKSCKKTSVLQYTYNAYKQDVNPKIVQFIKEGLGIRSTARVLKISVTTLLKRIISIAKNIKRPILSFGNIYELDEMRFFIRKKNNLQWLVYALDKETKQIANFYIGKRNNRTLNAVVKTLLFSQAKKIYTDKLKNYKYLIPKNLHNTRKNGTNHIERKNLDIRTCLKRFCRKTICFTKSMVILTAILKIYFWS